MVNKKDRPLLNEEELIEMTRDALADVLGREPTRQEVLRAHAGFKRMAFVMMEHLDRQDEEKTMDDKKEL